MLQGVASMLMGFHLSTLDNLDDLNPRNPYTDEHWAYPPTFILRTLLDEPDVIVRVNSTAAALNALVPPLLCSSAVNMPLQAQVMLSSSGTPGLSSNLF